MKTSQLDRAIASIDAQIEVLNLARRHLVEQVKPKPKAKPRVVKADEKSA